MKLNRLLLFPLLALVLAMFAAPTAAGAQDSTLGLSVVSVTEGTYPDGRIVVNVEDRRGDLPQLDASNFTASAGGSPLLVRSAELANSDEAPLDLLITIDTSGSMEGAPIAGAKAAARALIDSLPPADRVAVVGFGDQVTLWQDYTSDRGPVYAAIDGLVAQGNTALYQATAVSSFHVTTSKASRRAVILLSDGADFGGRSVATRDESLAAAAGVGVPFFTIAQGTDLDRPYLIELADRTQGRFLEAPQPQDLQGLYLEIGRLLRSQYVVTIDASPVATIAESTLDVTITSGGRTASAQGVFRPGPAFAPALTMTGISESDAVGDVRQVLVTVPFAPDGTTVSWFIDDEQALVSIEQPFVFDYDPAQYGEGSHTLRAVIGGAASPDEVTVTFSSMPPPAPAGGGPNMMLILAGVGAAIGAIIGFIVLRRRKRGKPVDTIHPDQRLTPWAKQVEQKRKAAIAETTSEIAVKPDGQQDMGEPMGLLISRGGSDLGKEYVVGGLPVAIGSGPMCGVRIDDAELGVEEARAWVRDGHLMVHRMSRLTMAADDGTGGGWAILEPGDTFPIGQHMFEFRLLDPAIAEPTAQPVAADATPNILRDAEGTGAEPQPRLRMPELMPKTDGGFMSGSND